MIWGSLLFYVVFSLLWGGIIWYGVGNYRIVITLLVLLCLSSRADHSFSVRPRSCGGGRGAGAGGPAGDEAGVVPAPFRQVLSGGDTLHRTCDGGEADRTLQEGTYFRSKVGEGLSKKAVI